MEEEFGKKKKTNVHYFKEENLRAIKKLIKEQAQILFVTATLITVVAIPIYWCAKKNHSVFMFFSIMGPTVVLGACAEGLASDPFLRPDLFDKKYFDRDCCEEKDYITPWLKIVAVFYSYLVILAAIFLWLLCS